MDRLVITVFTLLPLFISLLSACNVSVLILADISSPHCSWLAYRQPILHLTHRFTSSFYALPQNLFIPHLWWILKPGNQEISRFKHHIIGSILTSFLSLQEPFMRFLKCGIWFEILKEVCVPYDKDPNQMATVSGFWIQLKTYRWYSSAELNGEKYDTKGRFRRRVKKDVSSDKLIFSKENNEI
jgi:hypothetical protein